MGHSSLIYKISCRQDPIINIVCSTFQNKHDRNFHCSTITKTRRLISGSSCDKKAGASRVQKESKSPRLQEEKSNTVYLFINMYNLKKLYYV